MKTKKKETAVKLLGEILDKYEPSQKELLTDIFFRTFEIITELITEQSTKQIKNATKQVAKQSAEQLSEKIAKQIAIAIENECHRYEEEHRKHEEERRKYRNECFYKQRANTKLLLQHYNSLNSHYANAVWSDEEITNNFIDIMELMSGKYPETIIIKAIKKSAEETCIVMKHVNKMLDVYREQCKNSNHSEDARHWRVIKALYLLPQKSSIDDVAKQEHVDCRTVYRDIEAAVEDLTILFFGVEGIRKFYE